MYCSGYAYVGTSRGILPTMDMPLPELLMVDMLLPVMDMDMPLPGLLMVDMLLPAMVMDMPLPGPPMVIMLLPVMDMDMPLPGLLMADMFLPAMNMTCSWWIRPLPEPSITDMFSWIQPFSTIRRLLQRTGILFYGERPDLHFKNWTPSKCVY